MHHHYRHQVSTILDVNIDVHCTHTSMLFLGVIFETSTQGTRKVWDLHWDVDELHKVANESHDSKTNCDRSANLDEL